MNRKPTPTTPIAESHPEALAHDVCLPCWAELERIWKLAGVPSRVPLAANCARHEGHSMRGGA